MEGEVLWLHILENKRWLGAILVPGANDDVVSGFWSEKSEYKFAQPARVDEHRGPSMMQNALVGYNTFSSSAPACRLRFRSVSSKSEFMSLYRALDVLF